MGSGRVKQAAEDVTAEAVLHQPGELSIAQPFKLLDQTPQQLAPVIADLEDARLQDVVPVLVAGQTGDFRHELIHDGVLYASDPVLQDVLHQVVAAGFFFF